MAASSAPPSGVESTGLPAIVSRARTCPSPGVTISSVSVATGSSPSASGRPADAAVPAAGPERPARTPVVGRVGEHRAARAVEVAGQQVDDVDQPARERAGPHRGRAEPAVHAGAVRIGELTGQRPDGVGGDPAAVRDPFRAERREPREHLVEAVEVAASRSGTVTLPSSCRVWASAASRSASVPGADGEVEVGLRGGPGPARIDDHQPAAAALQRRQPAGEVRGRPQRAVGDPRVAAEHDQQVGPVDVGDRDGQRVAEQRAAADVLRQLVDARGAEDVARAQRLEERTDVELAREVVDVRVAEVDRHGVRTVVVDDRPQASGDLGVRVVPGGLDQLAVAADPGSLQPVRVGLELAEQGPLRAQVAAAEHVELVTADRDDAVTLHLEAQPAGGLAQRAGSDGWRSGAPRARPAPVRLHLPGLARAAHAADDHQRVRRDDGRPRRDARAPAAARDARPHHHGRGPPGAPRRRRPVAGERRGRHAGARAGARPGPGRHRPRRPRSGRERPRRGGVSVGPEAVHRPVAGAADPRPGGAERPAARRCGPGRGAARPGRGPDPVEDDGPGIPSDLGERIFDRFVRGDDRSPGMGLGLAVARSVGRRSVRSSPWSRPRRGPASCWTCRT
jgi:hypothetical protein